MAGGSQRPSNARLRIRTLFRGKEESPRKDCGQGRGAVSSEYREPSEVTWCWMEGRDWNVEGRRGHLSCGQAKGTERREHDKERQGQEGPWLGTIGL